MKTFKQLINEATVKKLPKTQTEMLKFWDDLKSSNLVKKYNKYGEVVARLAKPNERIITKIDGVKETETTAVKGDAVITGIDNEKYIISGENFRKRYKGEPLTLDEKSYKCTGICYAAEWTKNTLQFINCNGEYMLLNKGDFLSSPALIPDNDLYRIEGNIFPKTYK